MYRILHYCIDSPNKCVFNLNSLQYELENVDDTEGTIKIDCKNNVHYYDIEYSKWLK